MKRPIKPSPQYANTPPSSPAPSKGYDPLDRWELAVERMLGGQDSDETVGQIGWVSDGVYQTIDINDPRKMWVRYSENGITTAQSVLHMGAVAPMPDRLVRLGKTPRGDRYIIGRDFYDDAVSGSPDDGSVGVHYHDRWSGRMFLIDPRMRLQLRVEFIQGTTKLRVLQGWYEFNGQLYWLDTVEIDWSGSQPVTSGHHAWVVLGINTSTAVHEIITVTGTSQLLSLPLSIKQIRDVDFDWNHHIPILAFQLTNGQTTEPAEDKIESLLHRANSVLPLMTMIGSETLILSSDAITITQARSIIVAAQSGTSDDLKTINGTTQGQMVIVRADTGDTITIKHDGSGGNILLNGEADFVLTDEKALMLYHGEDDKLHDIGIGGASAFTDLTDVPASYSGQAGKVLAVNLAETDLEFITVGGIAVTSDDNVSSPPTDAELTAAFGSQPDGFVGVLDDNGAGTDVYLVLRKNSSWWHEAMTKAT